MILVKEITSDWVGVGRAPNHTYLMDDRMHSVIGYFKQHRPNAFHLLKTPLAIDTRYRKFKVLQTGYKFAQAKDIAPHWVIEGSKGHKYVVSRDKMGYNCSCVGYKFHGKCKHIDEVMHELA
jgi:hypothetical protein